MQKGTPVIYVEVECPKCGVDFDIDDNFDANAMYRLPGCDCEHRLGDVGQLCIAAENGWEWQVHPQHEAWARGEITGLLPPTPPDTAATPTRNAAHPETAANPRPK
jgi:hypothetical protein